MSEFHHHMNVPKEAVLRPFARRNPQNSSSLDALRDMFRIVTIPPHFLAVDIPMTIYHLRKPVVA